MIPAMVDPLGRYWKQPDSSSIALDDKTALMSQATFDALAEYAWTLPSGVYVGKMWRSGKKLAWYDHVEGDQMCIEWRQIEVLS